MDDTTLMSRTLLRLPALPDETWEWLVDRADHVLLADVAAHDGLPADVAREMFDRFDYARMRSALIAAGHIDDDRLVASLAGETRVTVLRQLAGEEGLSAAALAAVHRGAPTDAELVELVLGHPACNDRVQQQVTDAAYAALAETPRGNSDLAVLLADLDPLRLLEAGREHRVGLWLARAIAALDVPWPQAAAAEMGLLLGLMNEAGRGATAADSVPSPHDVAALFVAALDDGQVVEDLPYGDQLTRLFDGVGASEPASLTRVTARYRRTLARIDELVAEGHTGALAHAWDLADAKVLPEDLPGVLDTLMATGSVTRAAVAGRIPHGELVAATQRIDDVDAAVVTARALPHVGRLMLSEKLEPTPVRDELARRLKDDRSRAGAAARAWLVARLGWQHLTVDSRALSRWAWQSVELREAEAQAVSELARRPHALEVAVALVADGFDGNVGELVEVLDALTDPSPVAMPQPPADGAEVAGAEVAGTAAEPQTA